MKTLILISLALIISACAKKKIMADCENINGGKYFICKKQTDIE